MVGDVLLKGGEQSDGFVMGLLASQFVGLEDKSAVLQCGSEVLTGFTQDLGDNGFVFLGDTIAVHRTLNEVGTEAFADGRGKDFFLQEAQVGEHLDEFFSRVIDIEVFLQYAGRGDEHPCGEVEVAGLSPEGDDFLEFGGGARS